MKKVYLLWLLSNSTKAKLDYPGWLDSDMIWRETKAPSEKCARCRGCGGFQKGRKSNRWRRLRLSLQRFFSPEPWPFSKVDSIFPHVQLHCILTMGVKTRLDFCSNLSRQCLIKSKTPCLWVSFLGSVELLSLFFDLHKWLFETILGSRDILNHIEKRDNVLFKRL